MELAETIAAVLSTYGIDSKNLSIQRINSGHINHTFKVGSGYVLQRINKSVFLKPDSISNNLRAASGYLKINVPEYFFLTTLKNESGDDLVYDSSENPWRLFPFVRNTITIDEVDNANQAYEAARAFGQLSSHLTSCDTSLFEETIPHFHNLSLRFLQFEKSLQSASVERKRHAEKVSNICYAHRHLVLEYEKLVESGRCPLRITHNDTKINNVLFDKDSNKIVCVIDLDTLMPGYFLYDLGDMIRTFVSPASEDEIDAAKVVVRKEILDATLSGYLSEMGEVLTPDEKAVIPLAGPIMIYMIGTRFLTDYLQGDIYFQTTYSDQNLNRATNQFLLLEKLLR